MAASAAGLSVAPGGEEGARWAVSSVRWGARRSMADLARPGRLTEQLKARLGSGRA